MICPHCGKELPATYTESVNTAGQSGIPIINFDVTGCAPPPSFSTLVHVGGWPWLNNACAAGNAGAAITHIRFTKF